MLRYARNDEFGLIPFPNRSWREDKPRTVQLARQGEVDKVTDDLEMELISVLIDNGALNQSWSANGPLLTQRAIFYQLL